MSKYGVAPAFMFRPSNYVLPGSIFDSKAEATERARVENKYGTYRGKGCRAVACDDYGKIKGR